MTPPPSIIHNIYEMDEETRRSYGIESLPGSLKEALDELENDKLITDVLGEHVTRQYVLGKQKEWEEYQTRVSSWELEKYLVTY